MATIRVYPAPGGIVISHPSAGAVRTNGRGSLWPSDAFTHRRIADGSVTIEGGGVVNDVGEARRRIIDRVINPPEDK